MKRNEQAGMRKKEDEQRGKDRERNRVSVKSNAGRQMTAKVCKAPQILHMTDRKKRLGQD